MAGVKMYCRWCRRPLHAWAGIYLDQKNRMGCKKNPAKSGPRTHDGVVILVRAIPSNETLGRWDAWDVDGRYWFLQFKNGVGTMSHDYDTDKAPLEFEDSGSPTILFVDFLRHIGAVLYSDAEKPGTNFELPPLLPEKKWKIPVAAPCKWCGRSLSLWARMNTYGKFAGNFYLADDGSETCLKRPIVDGEAEHEPMASWINVRNRKTGATASALELTGKRVDQAQDILGSPSVKEGWWVIKYDDHSVRLYNPENFNDSYQMKGKP